MGPGLATRGAADLPEADHQHLDVPAVVGLLAARHCSLVACI